MTFAERFWAKVERGARDECWLWRGAKNSDGYGVIRTPEGLRLAHRTALVLHGRDPGHLVARHSCDTPACVNPAHLKAGTQAQNIRDAIARGRHNRGVRNGQSILDERKVRTIRSLAARGRSTREIAMRYGVSREAVRDVLSGRTWSHVAEAA